jgi:hypothetical protein
MRLNLKSYISRKILNTSNGLLYNELSPINSIKSLFDLKLQNTKWISSMVFIIPLIYTISEKKKSFKNFLWIINNFSLIFTSSMIHYYDLEKENLKNYDLYRLCDHIIILNLCLISIDNIIIYLFGYISLLFEYISNKNIKYTKMIIFLFNACKTHYIIYIDNKKNFYLSLLGLYGYKMYFNNDKRGYFLWSERIIWHISICVNIILCIKYNLQ